MVKLLPCDHEVTGSSPGNSLLQKCRERLRTIDPKWSDPSPNPAQAGATCTGATHVIIFSILNVLYVFLEKTKLKDVSSNDANLVHDLRFILIAAQKNYVLDAPLGD